MANKQGKGQMSFSTTFVTAVITVALVLGLFYAVLQGIVDKASASVGSIQSWVSEQQGNTGLGRKILNVLKMGSYKPASEEQNALIVYKIKNDEINVQSQKDKEEREGKGAIRTDLINSDVDMDLIGMDSFTLKQMHVVYNSSKTTKDCLVVAELGYVFRTDENGKPLKAEQVGTREGYPIDEAGNPLAEDEEGNLCVLEDDEVLKITDPEKYIKVFQLDYSKDSDTEAQKEIRTAKKKQILKKYKDNIREDKVEISGNDMDVNFLETGATKNIDKDTYYETCKIFWFEGKDFPSGLTRLQDGAETTEGIDPNKVYLAAFGVITLLDENGDELRYRDKATVDQMIQEIESTGDENQIDLLLHSYTLQYDNQQDPTQINVFDVKMKKTITKTWINGEYKGADIQPNTDVEPKPIDLLSDDIVGAQYAEFAIPIELDADFLNISGSNEFCDTFVDYALSRTLVIITVYRNKIDITETTTRDYQIPDGVSGGGGSYTVEPDRERTGEGPLSEIGDVFSREFDMLRELFNITDDTTVTEEEATVTYTQVHEEITTHTIKTDSTAYFSKLSTWYKKFDFERPGYKTTTETAERDIADGKTTTVTEKTEFDKQIMASTNDDRLRDFLTLLKNKDGEIGSTNLYTGDDSEELVEYEDIHLETVKVGELLENGEEMICELLSSSENTEKLEDPFKEIMDAYKNPEDYGFTPAQLESILEDKIESNNQHHNANPGVPGTPTPSGGNPSSIQSVDPSSSVIRNSSTKKATEVSSKGIKFRYDMEKIRNGRDDITGELYWTNLAKEIGPKIVEACEKYGVHLNQNQFDAIYAIATMPGLNADEVIDNIVSKFKGDERFVNVWKYVRELYPEDDEMSEFLVSQAFELFMEGNYSAGDIKAAHPTNYEYYDEYFKNNLGPINSGSNELIAQKATWLAEVCRNHGYVWKEVIDMGDDRANHPVFNSDGTETGNLSIGGISCASFLTEALYQAGIYDGNTTIWVQIDGYNGPTNIQRQISRFAREGIQVELVTPEEAQPGDLLYLKNHGHCAILTEKNDKTFTKEGSPEFNGNNTSDRYYETGDISKLNDWYILRVVTEDDNTASSSDSGNSNTNNSGNGKVSDSSAPYIEGQTYTLDSNGHIQGEYFQVDGVSQEYYGLSDEQVKTFAAVLMAESLHDPDNYFWVASAMFNRIDYRLVWR